ncbi:hypothetical protein HK405_004516 [Cladochytrium tenue]|nr:hypothetical protein HK405_004516 [Cladochytrium tenue]
MEPSRVGLALKTVRNKEYLHLIDRSTSPRFDISPLWADPAAFNSLVSDIVEYFPPSSFDVIVALDALGFILGGALAAHAHKGLVPLRKAGKLPLASGQLISTTFTDYDGSIKSLQARKDLLPPGMRVLLVDEWIGTGAQVKHAAEALEAAGCALVGIACLYLYPDSEGAVDIARRYDVCSSWSIFWVNGIITVIAAGLLVYAVVFDRRQAEIASMHVIREDPIKLDRAFSDRM